MKKYLALTIIALAAAAAMLPVAAKDKGKGPLSPAVISERTMQYRQLLSVLQNQYVDSLDMESLIKTGINAMLDKIDPYTEYYDLDNIDDLTSVSSGSYGGIGSGIMVRGDSVVELTEPYHGKPAYNAGVRHGDIILEIDDYVVPSSGLDSKDISNRLKGNPGTHVRVRARRPWLTDGSDSIFVFDIERAKVSIDPVPFTTVFDDGIAYIAVSTFNRNTADEIRNAFADIKEREGKNLKGVILDLRNNGGGIIEGAINLLSIFVDRGTTVTETRYRDGSVVKYKTRKSPVDTRLPLVVMVNGNTASASEIVSGAIQDLDRGVIMGRRTFGKGLVQTSAPLGYGGVLKYTTGKYYLPSGRLVQALDYRDSNGRPTLIPDSLTTEYRTHNGRLVRDGRGVSPDVALKADTTSQLAWQLYSKQWIYDFANRYRNTHPEAPAGDSIVTAAVYEDFKAFVDPSRLEYGKASRNGIDYLREAAAAEGLRSPEITAAIDTLERLMKHDLGHELDANRDEIMEMLEVEIADRYFAPGEIEGKLIKTDTDVLEARKLLLDPERYRLLLLPTDKAPQK